MAVKMTSKPALGFILLFFAVAMSIYVALEFVPQQIYQAVNDWNAVAVAWCLNIIGIQVTLKGDLITHAGFTAKVVGECSAVFVSVLPLSFFLAYPARPLRRLAGILIGLPFLFGINIIRIAIVFIVGFSQPKLFPWVHLYLGQVGMILVVVWICMVWLEWEKRETAGLASGVFVLKVLAVSILPFIAWIWVCQPYTRMVLTLAAFILEQAGLAVVLPKVLEIYPHTFISFNVIVIFSFFAAAWMAKKSVRPLWIILGTAGLTGVHILFHILPFLFFQHQIKSSGWLINSFLVINQFILPFVFWILVSPKPRSSKRPVTDSNRPAAGTGAGEDVTG